MNVGNIVGISEAIDWCSLRVALVGNYVGSITLSSTVPKFVEFPDLCRELSRGVLFLKVASPIEATVFIRI